MQNPKARSGSSDLPKKPSPKAVRQLNPPSLDVDSASSTKSSRNPRESPKVSDRRSPRSPVQERKRPSKISELESQISQLQDDLKKVKDELSLSESCKKEAQQDAEESKKRLLALSEKLQDTGKRFHVPSDSKETLPIEFEKATEKHNQAWESELEIEIVQRQVLLDSDALASALSEIHQLKNQLEVVSESEKKQTKHAELAEAEVHNLKLNLAETLYLVENMKRQLNECKQSESDCKSLFGRTLQQLETAKKAVEVLRGDDAKAVDAYNLVSSRARVKFLEALVDKLEIDISSSSGRVGDGNLYQGAGKAKNVEEPDSMELEIYTLKNEIAQLRSQLETAEIKYHEEQIESTVKMRTAYELVEQMKVESTAREAELQTELGKKLNDIEELKANLMDKETELQGILEENEGLNLNLQKKLSTKIDGHDSELKVLNECIAELRANLMDKETTLQSISEENEMLKLEMGKRVSEYSKVTDQAVGGVELTKVVDSDALVKLGIVMEEADRSSRKVARVAEQLEAAQTANSEIEAEMRKLKVQSDQWRKAAEAAAAMLAAGNNDKLMERTASLDNNYHSVRDKCPTFPEDMDDNLQKKKNGNMLKKIGVLWKKPQK